VRIADLSQHALAIAGVGTSGASLVGAVSPSIAGTAGICAIIFYGFQIWESRTIRSRIRLHRLRWARRHQIERLTEAKALALRQAAEALALRVKQEAEAAALSIKYHEAPHDPSDPADCH